MVKKSLIQRSLKKYNLKQKYFGKWSFLKKRLHSTLTLLKLFKLQNTIQKLPLNSSKTRFKNFCWKTGRNRGYFRNFSLSRHVIREMAHKGLLPGITKSSW